MQLLRKEHSAASANFKPWFLPNRVWSSLSAHLHIFGVYGLVLDAWSAPSKVVSGIRCLMVCRSLELSATGT